MDAMTRSRRLRALVALAAVPVALPVLLAGCGSAAGTGVAQVTASGSWDASALGQLAAAAVPASPAEPTPAGPGPLASPAPARPTTAAVPPGTTAAAVPGDGGTTFPVPAGGAGVGVAGSGQKPAVAPASRTPAAVPAKGVVAVAQTQLDLAYGTSSVQQKLDLVLPARAGAAVPLVVVVHGGAFVEGDKADEAQTLQALAARGYAAASVNYRLSGEAPFPAAVKDVKAAVRWLRAHAPTYGVDPDRVGIWGESAGGYLAAMVGATTGRATEFDDPALGNAGVSSDVAAVVDWYGPIDFGSMDAQNASPGGCPGVADVHGDAASPESRLLGAAVRTVPSLVARANPITYLQGARPLPKFLVAHGVADCQVPQGQSIEFASALRAAGAQVTLTLMPGVGHGGAAFVAGQQPGALDFLDGILRR